MSKMRKISEGIYAAFVFSLAFGTASIFTFVITISLYRSVWIGISLSLLLMIVLSYIVKRKSKAALYGIITGFAFLAINILLRMLQK